MSRPTIEESLWGEMQAVGIDTDRVDWDDEMEIYVADRGEIGFAYWFGVATDQGDGSTHYLWGEAQLDSFTEKWMMDDWDGGPVTPSERDRMIQAVKAWMAGWSE